jgi:hypothetical protein
VLLLAVMVLEAAVQVVLAALQVHPMAHLVMVAQVLPHLLAGRKFNTLAVVAVGFRQATWLTLALWVVAQAQEMVVTTPCQLELAARLLFLVLML